jgi:CRISPR system Cascade subunit CasC
MYIDLHIIQTLPYSNLNRDDAGTPKTMTYGGSTRARVSSQAWKRAARLVVETEINEAKTYRTRNPHLRLIELLLARDIEADRAANVAETIFFAIGTDTSNADSSVILYVAESELHALVGCYFENQEVIDKAAQAKALAKNATNTKAPKGATKDEREAAKAAASAAKDAAKEGTEAFKGKLLDCLKFHRPTTIALFGRMLASAPEINVDGSLQVAHAFSIHPIDIEMDYFTAAEDLPSSSSAGGAHLGNAEFVSATLYRYATLNTSELTANVGADPTIARTLGLEALRALCLSIPTGKTNVTAPHTVPDLVRVVVRSDRPVCFAAGFEYSLNTGTDRNTIAAGSAVAGATRLAEHGSRVNRMLSSAAVYDGHVSALHTDVEGLGTPVISLAELLANAFDHAFSEQP